MDQPQPVYQSPGTSEFQLLQARPGITMILLPDTPVYTIVAVSNDFLTASGRTREEVIGKSHFAVFPENPADSQSSGIHSLKRSFETILQYKKPHSLPLVRYDIPDGQGGFLEKYWKSSNAPFLNEDGEVVYIIHTSEDVTALVNAEQTKEAHLQLLKAHQKVEQTNERFDLVTKATQDAIWDWNLLTDEIWWNEGFKELFGYNDEDIEATIVSWYSRVHPEDAERVVGGIHDVIDNGGKKWASEYRFRKKDGTYAIVYDRGYALHDKDGKPYRMLGSMQDITERKMSEITLAESEARFRTLANSITQLAWMADAEGWIYWYNERWYEYTGTTLEEMQGWGWEKVHHPEHIDRVVAFVKDAWTKTQPWELIFPLRSADGQYNWFLTRATPVLSSEGKILQWIGTNTNIDEHKRAEVLLEQKVKERTQELELRNRELEQFTYVSHHDLQEPLRKIHFYADMIRAELYNQLPEASRGRFDKITNAASRMSMALRDVLDFASLNKEEQFKEVDLNTIIRDVKTDLELVISEKEAELHFHSLPTIRAVPQQMYQLFYNLINNALKFSKPGVQPFIQLSCSLFDAAALKQHPELNQTKQYYGLVLQDNGIGFDPDAREKIFDMFQRLHSKNAYAGTGIGLALCKKVVTNHKGKIWAESGEDVGATFKLLLPVE